MWLFQIKKIYLGLLFVLPFFLLAGISSIGEWFILITSLFIFCNLFLVCRQICIWSTQSSRLKQLDWSFYLTLLLILLFFIDTYFQITAIEDTFLYVLIRIFFALGFIGFVSIVLTIPRIINNKMTLDIATYFKYFVWIVFSPLCILFIKDSLIKTGWIEK
jgi:hypothetical protein